MVILNYGEILLKRCSVLTFDFNKYRKLELQDQVLGFKSKRGPSQGSDLLAKNNISKMGMQISPKKLFQSVDIGSHHSSCIFKT